MREETIKTYDIINRFQYHRPAIEKSMPILDGICKIEHILADILHQRKFFFENDHAFCIVEFVQYPMKKYLNLFLSGGKLVHLDELFGQVEDFARANKCSKLLGPGRAEWAKANKRYNRGWTQRVILMEKEL
jgi:hypothetical protein